MPSDSGFPTIGGKNDGSFRRKIPLNVRSLTNISLSGAIESANQSPFVFALPVLGF